MDPNNRLYLNFGNNNERLAPSDRQYPTTPSTFPQPVFPTPSQQHLAAQQPQSNQQYAGGYASSNAYYAPNPYQAPTDYISAQAATAYQPRSNTPGTNDPNVGLAHQFSHQNLGGGARGNAYGARGPSPAQRPRTAGSGQPQPGYSYLNAPMPAPPAVRQPDFQPAPERNPEKYGLNANNNQKKCSQLAADFFKDSVKRARERNLR